MRFNYLEFGTTIDSQLQQETIYRLLDYCLLSREYTQNIGIGYFVLLMRLFY